MQDHRFWLRHEKPTARHMPVAFAALATCLISAIANAQTECPENATHEWLWLLGTGGPGEYTTFNTTAGCIESKPLAFGSMDKTVTLPAVAGSGCTKYGGGEVVGNWWIEDPDDISHTGYPCECPATYSTKELGYVVSVECVEGPCGEFFGNGKAVRSQITWPSWLEYSLPGGTSLAIYSEGKLPDNYKYGYELELLVSGFHREPCCDIAGPTTVNYSDKVRVRIVPPPPPESSCATCSSGFGLGSSRTLSVGEPKDNGEALAAAVDGINLVVGSLRYPIKWHDNHRSHSTGTQGGSRHAVVPSLIKSGSSYHFTGSDNFPLWLNSNFDYSSTQDSPSEMGVTVTDDPEECIDATWVTDHHTGDQLGFVRWGHWVPNVWPYQGGHCVYPPAYRLMRIRDGISGAYGDATWTSDGLVESLSDNSGDATRKLWFTYDRHLSDPEPWPELTGISIGGPTFDDAEQVLALNYLPSGLIARVSGSCSSCGFVDKSFEYDSASRLTVIKEEGKIVAHYHYDTGREGSSVITKVTAGSADGSGPELKRRDVRYAYDYQAQEFTTLALTKYNWVTDASARVRIEEFATEDPSQPTTTPNFSRPTAIVEYSTFGDLAVPTSSPIRTELGVSRVSTSDLRAQKFFEVSPNGVTKASYVDVAGAVSEASRNRVTMETLEHDSVAVTVARYEYASMTAVAPVGGAEFPVTRLSKTTNQYGGASEYFYSNGALTKQVGPLVLAGRHTTEYRYDDHQRVTKQWHDSGMGQALTSCYTYDSNADMVTAIEAYGTAGAGTTTYAYDSAHRVTKTTDPRGSVKRRSYSSAGALRSEWAYVTGGSGLALSRTEYDYNAQGQMTMKRVVDSVSPFDPESQSVAEITTKHVYDWLGRKLTTIEDFGNLNLTYIYEYDNQDELVKSTTPAGVWTQIQRDGRGLVVSETTGCSNPALTQVASYVYDNDRNVVTSVAATGAVTRYEYNELGRRTKVIEDD